MTATLAVRHASVNQSDDSKSQQQFGQMLNNVVNSAFHPSGVDKSSTSLWAGVKAGCFAWQVTLCDPIWQVTPHSSDSIKSSTLLYNRDTVQYDIT